MSVIAAVTGMLRLSWSRMLSSVDHLQQRHRWLSVPVAVIRKASDDQGGSLGVLIAYYGFLGIFPLLLVFAAVVGFVLAGNPGLKDQALRSVESSFPALSGYIDATVSGSGVALGVGLAGALWAGLGVTRATERAMNTIWDIPLSDRPNPWQSRLRGLVMLAILGATFLASAAVASLTAGGGPLGAASDVIGVVGSFGLNTMLYLLAFRVLTNRHLAWPTVLPGALAGAAVWTALLNLGAIYVRHEISHASRLYGSLAVVVGLLAWIYLGARVTIYAAEINVVLAERLWPRSLRGPASTEADRRALARQAHEAQRGLGETITVTFAGAAAQEPSAGDNAGSAADMSPAGLHQALTISAVEHLEALDQARRTASACPDDPEERRALIGKAASDAALAALALRGLAAHDADLAAALKAAHLDGNDRE